MERIIKSDSLSHFNLRDIWLNREILYFLAWRDIKVRYKDKFIAVIWSLIQPLLAIIIFTIVFRKIAHIFSGEIPYAPFAFVGFMFWNYFFNSLNRVSNSIVANSSLVSAIFFSRIIIPISAMTVGFVDFLLSFPIFLLILFHYNKLIINPLGFLWFLPSFILVFFTSLGLGLFFSALQVQYRDSRRMLPFFMQLLFFMTPVIYPIKFLSRHVVWVYLNPLVGAIEIARAGLFKDQVFNWEGLIVSALASFLIFIFGLFYFIKNQALFADIL